MPAEVLCATEGCLAQADDLRERLRTALARADHLTLDLAGLESADLSFVQLIESARLQAASEHKTIVLAAPAPAPLARVIDRSGLLWASEPADLQFWFHGEREQ